MMDIEPHFWPSWPTLVTVLEDIAEIDLEHTLKEITFPQYLFTVQQIAISRILGRGKFEIIEVIQLLDA